jgi:DNA mismatch repair protein MutS
MPSAPPRDVSAPAARDPRATPAMQQHARFKAAHPGCILLFRMGDFYELFHDDAVLVHEVLGLTLTQRTEGIPMAGVPYHALDGYAQKLVDRGYRVAVCDQIQDPKDAKGVVERAVTRVLTPGTLVDEALLDESRPNQVAAIDLRRAGGRAGEVDVALAEVSTGRFLLVTVREDALADEIARLGPRELLYAETDGGATPPAVVRLRAETGCAVTPRPAWSFGARDASERLRAHFGVRTLAGFGLDDGDTGLGAAGALLAYLSETQAPDGGAGRTLAHLRPPRREPRDATLIIDQVSLRSLEIERTMRSGDVQGSLLAVMQGCRTPMGKRLLREWLCFPLRDRGAIEARQRCVAELAGDEVLAAGLAESLAAVQDVARIASRATMRRATPRDVAALGRSLDRGGALVDLVADRPALAPQHRALERLWSELAPLGEEILGRCVDAPPAHLREGGLFRDGVDAALDEARLLMRDATSWLAQYQARLVAETAIPSLKVGYNRVFGYYIEVTNTHAAKVPDAFSRTQTLKNAERYVTADLKAFEGSVTTAESRAIERERSLFEDLCAAIAARAGALLAFADVVAELDVLARFAAIAVRERWTRPVIADAPVLHIRGGRHPVLAALLRERFVPNDCVLGARANVPDPGNRAAQALSAPGRGEGEGPPGQALQPGECAAPGDDAPDRPAPTLALITGPNMAGKSTAIRQAAVIAILAHTGSFVPAESATVGIVDRIFTRIGASDELHQGQSTFMVEMTETANILHQATDRSLVILDEIGRGTSTLDGLALAWAIAESIAGIRCRALFATHYHELTDLADRFDNVANLHVAVREWGEEIVFLYRIQPGRTDRSYGIHVARIAGLPRATIARAQEVLESLAVHTGGPALAVPPAAGAEPRGQLELFTEYIPHPAVQRLRALDLDAMTPLEAFDALRALVKQARE